LKDKKLKILIIRFSSIGDIVLTSPVIRCLKEQVKGIELHFLSKKAFETVLAGNPHLDKIHYLESSLSDCIQELKKEKFDYIIDLHHNLRTLWIKTKLGVKSSSFDKLNLQKWLLVNFKRNTLPPVHIVDRYLQTVEFLGAKNDSKGLDYFLLKSYNLKEMLPLSHQSYIAVVIGAQHSTKRLPVEKLTELCMGIKGSVVLLGGPEDKERAEEIAKAAGQHIFNGCGEFKLDESAFLISRAQKVITHDTGLMHIAAAFNKPIVSVWGNTLPEFGMYPYKADYSKIIQVKDLSCRPCSKIGFNSCPKGHFKCMNLIDLNLVIKESNA
jgi:ADP-heptose:LPS heptosyltransferase